MENILDAPLSDVAQKLVAERANLRNDIRVLANMSMVDLIRKYKIKNKDKFNAEEKAQLMQQDELRQLRAQEDRLTDLLNTETQKSWITKNANCESCKKLLRPSDTRYVCPDCRRVVYCDETCFEDHWHKHYRICK